MPRPPKAKSAVEDYAVHLGVEFGFGPESAVFVLANGSMSSNQSGEGDIRRALIEADLVDCMVALPGQPRQSSPSLSIHAKL
jgi:type I restriction-modification system DNA methylase subunit